jgi:hypothetical protein
MIINTDGDIQRVISQFFLTIGTHFFNSNASIFRDQENLRVRFQKHVCLIN